MKRSIYLILLIFLLFSCSKENSQVNDIIDSNTWASSTWTSNTWSSSDKWVIEETSDIIEWYWDTLKGSIDWAREVQESINNRYNGLDTLLENAKQ